MVDDWACDCNREMWLRSLRQAKFELSWENRWRVNRLNGDAVNCRSQLRMFQKLYNADPWWNGKV